MPFSLSARFEQLNTAQKLDIFRFLFLFHFVIFNSLSTCLLPARPLFLVVLHNSVKNNSRKKGMTCDMLSEQRISHLPRLRTNNFSEFNRRAIEFNGLIKSYLCITSMNKLKIKYIWYISDMVCNYINLINQCNVKL